jgi:hypothetical protein
MFRTVMKTSSAILLIMVTSICLVGCRKEGQTDDVKVSQNEKRGISRVYDTNALGLVIRVGTTEFDILKNFGEPDYRIIKDTNRTIITYLFPIPTNVVSNSWQLSGFRVFIKDGHVTGWGPIHTDYRDMFRKK